MRKLLAALAATAGVLTIVTAVLFARMPDPFVSQFGWFVILLGATGGSMLIGTALWHLSGREPRTASAVTATLALGDFACNAAALKAASLGVVPAPNALHGLTGAVSIVLAIVGIAALLSSSASAAPARPRAGWAAALMLAGAVVGGAAALEGMLFRALEPHRAAAEACTASTISLDASERATCIAREEAKPLSTTGFLVGVGGFGAMALGAGALAGALRSSAGGTRTMTTLWPTLAVAAFLAAGSLVVAAAAGVEDLNRLHQGCRPAEPTRKSRAMVLSVGEQAFRSCVVAKRGVNPWGATFWGAFAIGAPALITSGSMLTTRASDREDTPADHAPTSAR